MSEVCGSYAVSEILFASGPWSVARTTGPDGRPARLTMLDLPADLSEPERAGLVAAIERDTAARPPSTPALLAVLACGETDGRLWLAETAPTGRSVRETVAASGPMEAERVIPLLHQVGNALDPVRAAGLAHAWLSPDNVYLEPGALVGGLAWSAVAAALRALRPGAPWPETAFLAPEIQAGAAPDARAEAFSAAALAVFATTGQTPTPGLSLDALPPALAAAFSRSLTADPSARHRGVKALAVDVTVERAIAMQDAADQTAVPSGGDVPEWARDLLLETSARRESGQPLVEVAPVETKAAEPRPAPSPAAMHARPDAPPPPRSVPGPAPVATASEAAGPARASAPARSRERPSKPAAAFDWNGAEEKRSWTSVALAVVSVLFVLAAIALTILK